MLTVRERGRGSLKNGELLEAAQREFDPLLTADRGIPHQQNVPRFDLIVVALRAKSNAIKDLQPLVREIPKLLANAGPGQVIYVGG